jgi:hypothetical protein
MRSPRIIPGTQSQTKSGRPRTHSKMYKEGDQRADVYSRRSTPRACDEGLKAEVSYTFERIESGARTESRPRTRMRRRDLWVPALPDNRSPDRPLTRTIASTGADHHGNAMKGRVPSRPHHRHNDK